MSLLGERDASALRSHLARTLVTPVELQLFVEASSEGGGDGGDACSVTRALLRELVELSGGKLSLEVRELSGSERSAHSALPELAFAGRAQGRARFLGVPAGLEIFTLLEDLGDLSRGETSLSATSRQALKGLDRDVRVRVFVTPTCPFCPKAARLAHQLAFESPHVFADVIEANDFPELSARYGVHGVPKTVIGEDGEVLGAQPERTLVETLLRHAHPPDEVLHAAP